MQVHKPIRTFVKHKHKLMRMHKTCTHEKSTCIRTHIYIHACTHVRAQALNHVRLYMLNAHKTHTQLYEHAHI